MTLRDITDFKDKPIKEQVSIAWRNCNDIDNDYSFGVEWKRLYSEYVQPIVKHVLEDVLMEATNEEHKDKYNIEADKIHLGIIFILDLYNTRLTEEAEKNNRHKHNLSLVKEKTLNATTP